MATAQEPCVKNKKYFPVVYLINLKLLDSRYFVQGVKRSTYPILST